MLEGVISRLDGEEPWREWPSDGVGRAIVGAAPAIGAGIEIQHMLPGEVLERLYAERFHLIEMLVAHAPADGLDRSLIQLGKVHVEQRRFHVELNSKWPIAQQEVKGQNV